MLVFLFPLAHRTYADSPVAVWLLAFANWLVEVGYSRPSAREHVRRLREALEGQGPAVAADAVFSQAGLEGMFTVRAASLRRHNALRATRRAFSRFLAARHPQQLVVEADEGVFAELLSAYHGYLLEVRGFAPATATQHVATTRSFLTASVPEGSALCELSRRDVEGFVVRAGRRLRRASLQHTIAQLRAFLRYCFERGLIAGSLDQIDTPRTYRDELPPRALPWPLVEALLASIDRTGKGGYRDHAMLHLMAHYGLRPCEVAALRVDALDRDARTLRVAQRKTRSVLVLPLSTATLQVLDTYLAEGRPASGEAALFLRRRSPGGPLQHYAVGNAYQKRASESGLPLAGTSAYALRHGFAMRLLDGGVSVKTIGDLLGHHTLEATSVYLRLQTETLRPVALPVPAEATSSLGGCT